MKRSTPATEDYLETIYELTKSKGYAKVVDISRKLGVKPPTVTIMIQKLSKNGLLKYERYRDISLTQPGKTIAKNISDRHSKIMKFLTILGVDKKTAYVDTEGIEHHMHPSTLKRIHELVLFAEKNPKWLDGLKKFHGKKHNY
ncbi:MAG: transcriptional regulator MntR [Candidatus Aenigmarchaeota archaeon]|nr:transcriptional regulator MntR [Candidatus Aenigmarchaeota archaeon]